MLFSIQHEDPDSKARLGRLELAHGPVLTPCFMPVGTNATVKAVRSKDLEDIGLNLILSNTYHLYLRPGIEVIEQSGGLHRFMAWKHNILTDSGGFQVFSLSPFRKIEEQGICFKSHLDGSTHRLSPEDIVDIQRKLGSDILMPLDFCTPVGISREEASKAADLTTRWARRSLIRWEKDFSPPAGQLFGIIQGNFFKELREKSAEEIISLGFPGYAIGGLSVGEQYEVFKDYLRFTAEFVPSRYPRYLMGVGTPQYILEAVENGVDLFDCVFPTRTARNAQAFTKVGPLSLKKESNKFDSGPIDPGCSCSTCINYSRSYLRHLFKTKEILAAMLTTYHNLYFIHQFILAIREAIRNDSFTDFKQNFRRKYDSRL
ncbi:Queuine tRNA-ribosyltransferase [subsurface metagenome]